MSGKTENEKPVRDKPWMFRTYAGHSTAKASNELYRKNLAKGQTGLSIAFDLPTQTGYDSDSPLARGEVGKVGVPVSHLGDMRTLLDGIPLGEMNTSMTINAPAAWLLSLYVSLADEQGTDRGKLTGTTQNDIIKEYLSRGTYVFPPDPSLRLIKDVIVFTNQEVPKWNPTNVCSYHLQEAGATPAQELAFALATAQAVLDRLGVDQLEDRDARAEAILAEVQRQWQKAPPIRRMPDGPVRMTGFPVMLSEGDKPVTQILLVPYYGACIHSPPPPANQAVLVTLDRELPRQMYQFPVWVTGTLEHAPAVTPHGRVLYRMREASWQPHPWPRQPLPVYRLP